MSFVFFDTETTGLSRAFDQIVHFSAIRADNDLRETDRFEALSRIPDHLIPHPQALSVNGLCAGQLYDLSRPSHYAMARVIRERLLSWSPAIFVGFNSIRFDEEMLRQAFYQTLHPPYLTSLHNNGRADALGLTLAASATCPGSITVPLSSEGKPIFRLPELAAANGITHTPHNPMSDVEATLALCRLAQARAPDVWQRFVRFSRKATTADFVDCGDPFVLTEFFANEAYHSPVVCIGEDPKQSTLRYCLALNGRTRALLTMSDDDLCNAIRCKASPVRKLRVNASPVMTPLYEIDTLPDLDHDEIEALAQEIRANSDECARILRLYLGTPEASWPEHCVEERIYAGFVSSDDEFLMGRFHEAPWEDRLNLVLRFKDARLRTLGLRLIYLEAPSLLPVSLAHQVRAELAQRHHDGENAALSIPRALEEIDALLASQDPLGKAMLLEYRDYLIQRIL